MGRIKHDKLTEIFSMRIPSVTKAGLDSMPSAWKTKLNERLLICIAQVLHESRFDPSFYLVEKYNEIDSEAK